MAVVSYNSPLKRTKWMMEGLATEAKKAFWSPLTGNSFRSAVYQTNDLAATKQGHSVVFQFGGALSGAAIAGKDTAYGTGEVKRQFSDSIRVNRYRFTANNDDAFDAVDIGNLALAEHANARALLSEHFMKWFDQMVFDNMAGIYTPPSHRVSYAKTDGNTSSFGYNAILDLEEAIKTGEGVDTSVSGVGASYANRRPLRPARIEGNQDCWLLVVDSSVKNLLMKDPAFQRIATGGDIRGRDNILLKGVVGKIGSLIVMEAGSFFGDNTRSLATAAGNLFNASKVEIAGLRRFSVANATNDLPQVQFWRGDDGYSTSAAGGIWTRCLLVGQGAVQVANGKMPDYRIQTNTDFAIDSESCLETWLNIKKTRMNTEQGEDYDDARITNMDYGVIAVDVQVSGS